MKKMNLNQMAEKTNTLSAKAQAKVKGGNDFVTLTIGPDTTTYAMGGGVTQGSADDMRSNKGSG